ncbi:MAG: discoidin domain-containing protein, partial [Chloroflexi bacterium]|nr:discoidin domain-containing protein [Chloroflexota bacterium]
IGPDGTVYRSEDLTFRTLPLDLSVKRKPYGENLALLSESTRIVGTSSNFGGADNAGAWGANKAFDGDPSTAWSSSGDGNDAWIEIELLQETHVTALGFWTRTMGTSAQISSFNVLTDRDETYGPFTLEDASQVHMFETDFTAKRLRFEVVDSSGGNTGAVEIEVYGNPLP